MAILSLKNIRLPIGIDLVGRMKMYKWKTHPWAKYLYGEEMFARMREFTPEKIQTFLQKVRKELPKDGKTFLTQKRIQNLFVRAAELYKIGHTPAHNRKIYSPRTLGNTYSGSIFWTAAAEALNKITPVNLDITRPANLMLSS